jgi:hypothetical protein
MKGSANESAHHRRLGPNGAAFLLGLPLAALVLGLIHFGPLRDGPARRYVEHPVEWVEVVLFCCALGALAAKWSRARAEAKACHAEALPRWDGKPVAPGEAPALLAGLGRAPHGWAGTLLGRRVRAVLDFVCRRRCAADLDDQMRALAEDDALALEGSYALVRFITWAIPILGFLGTVLGITQAIAGVTPEVLEQSLSHVTDGLAEAFDCTALALGLTMVVMFLTSLTERREQAVLEGVDRHVSRELAHRFQREGPSAGPFVEAMREQSRALLGAVEESVRRHAELLEEALARSQPAEQLKVALADALERTLEAHARRLEEVERQVAGGVAPLVQQMSALAASVRETGQQQQSALVQVAEGVGRQAAVLGRLQEGAANVVHLQAVLHQNLAALASASNFEEAVHSLTAAVHLLTSRVAGGGASLQAVSPPRAKPGRAA